MCLVVLLGMLVPRVTLFLLWFFTTWVDNVFKPWWLGVLGFIMLPYTTLAYVLLHRWSGDVTISNTAHLIVMIVALVIDLSSWGGGHRTYSRRRTIVVRQ